MIFDMPKIWPRRRERNFTDLEMDTLGEGNTQQSRMVFEVRDGIEMVPGTVHLVDTQGLSNLKHRTGHGAGDDVVLIPQPSNDPDDPLNWSPRRKEYHFWNLIIWAILVAASVNWSGPVWVPLQYALNTTIDDLNISSAIGFGFLAIGVLVLQPTSMKIGRRPIYIIGTFLNLVGCILGGFQQTVEVYYVVNILTGFGAAPGDSLVQISTTDVFFAHERGTRLASFALALGAGSFMGPVAAGYITESQGWRFCFWYLVIFFGILLVVQIFSLEESLYRRPLQHPERLGELKIQDGSKQDIADKKPLTRDGECPTPQTLDDGILPIASDADATRSNSELVQPRPKMTYRQRMAPIHIRNADPKPWWYLFLFPFRLVLFPAVVWTGVLGGIQIMWLSLLSVTQSELFGAAPYNFGIAAVGDTNIAAFVGGFFGMLWGGPLSDWYVVHRARHNKGIMEPEFRLWLLIVPALVNTAGLLMYGIGAYRGLPWIISAGIGTGFIGFGIGAGGAIGLTYAIDCYPGIAAESMVLILFIRNVLGLLFTLAIQPWIDAMGGQNTTIIMASICLVSMMSFLFIVKWGKRFRAGTAVKYLRYTEDRARHG